MFNLIDAKSLLDKANIDLATYNRNPCSNNIFNLFVTIRHIEDYAKYKFKTKKSRKKHHNKVKKHFGNLYEWMLFVCNKQKHCKVTRGNVGTQMDAAHVQHILSGTINGAAINELPVNGGDEYRIEYNGVVYEIGDLARQLIVKWDDFLKQEGY